MFPGLCSFPRSAKIKCLYTINERHSPAACFPHVQTVSSNPTQPCSPSLHHFHPFPLKNMMGTVRWTDGSCVDRNISPGGRERERETGNTCSADAVVRSCTLISHHISHQMPRVCHKGSSVIAVAFDNVLACLSWVLGRRP